MIASARAAVPDGFPLSFIIVDGGSTDGTIEWCKSQADIELIEHRELRGAITSFTEGAYHSAAKYTLLANDDIVFQANSILRAIVHLEDTPTCGAVAFADNRIIPPWWTTDTVWHVAGMPAIRNGQYAMVNYAQVGLFRTWLGNKVNWWRGDCEGFKNARTYAGDNMLSANLWRLGFSVDEVAGCRVNDRVYEDDLRKDNHKTGQADSNAYYDCWKNPHSEIKGPIVATMPLEPNFDKMALRILYLPIYEPGHKAQHEQKHGLRDALMRRSIVYELDYLALSADDLRSKLLGTGGILDTFLPHMILMQCHGVGQINRRLLLDIKTQCPRVVIYNWNGDVHEHGLIAPEMLDLLQLVDLQLVVNAGVLPFYAQQGINAAYWQIGYEECSPLPDDVKVQAHDVVFLGNCYSEERKRLAGRLRDTTASLGLYGGGWGGAGNGENLYDFATACAVYRAAKISIGDNQYPDAYGFISNRIFQALAAGGALYLQQTVKGLEELTGLQSGKHYVEWTDYADMEKKIAYYLSPANERERKRIAKAGTEYVVQHHSFDARVKELFTELVGLAKRKPRVLMALRYIGRNPNVFGVVGPATNMHYQCIPTLLLHVDPLDGQVLAADNPQRWEIVETPESEALVSGD